jgi:dipeptide/tripeptide permease
LFQSLNALFVVVFTPLLVLVFGALASRKRDVSTARKMFYGLCLTTASLLLMAVAGLFSDGGASKVSGLWLVGFYAIITIGELMLSPMGLSLVTKLAPKRLVGLAMGGWFLATAFGNNFSGFFGGIQSMMPPFAFFLVLSGLAASVALFIYLLLDRLDKAIEASG